MHQTLALLGAYGLSLRCQAEIINEEQNFDLLQLYVQQQPSNVFNQQSLEPLWQDGDSQELSQVRSQVQTCRATNSAPKLAPPKWACTAHTCIATSKRIQVVHRIRYLQFSTAGLAFSGSTIASVSQSIACQTLMRDDSANSQ